MIAQSAQTSFGDWIEAISNALLALSIIVGAAFALTRWYVVFVLRTPEHPSLGEFGGEGLPTVRSTSWKCDLQLAEGKAAHIARVKLQRRNHLGLWRNEKQSTFAHDYMPVSLLPQGELALTVSIGKGTKGPFRIKIQEYATMRRSYIPFVEPERKNDFA
ncbi:MAG: hypothetical protein H7124_09140 [Phycisphaerales bacterium]|nr:hypothetical protein [Hyphomonadaceae bacterium]